MPETSNPWATSAQSGADGAASSGADAVAQTPDGAASGGADAAAGAANPWGASGGTDAGVPAGAGSSTPDWLSQAAPPQQHHFDIMHPFDRAIIPIEGWVEHFLDWVVANFRPIFQAVRLPIDWVLSAIQTALLGVPAVVMILLLGLLAWQAAGPRLGIGAVIALTFIGAIGAWDQSMVTLALVFTSVFFCILIGLPTGIFLARNDRAAQIIRPILDAMQTTPAFVYLVPIVMLFGIGNVPGVIVTIIFALPPLIRLTNLGIRQVPGDLIEAAKSFGASKRQLLYKVQLPIAMPTIMAGVNQTLMLALSMVVIASMIAVGGLGQMVLRGIGRLDMGLATVGGIGIVLLAIIIDRMTQSLGITKRERGNIAWYDTGPIGLVRRLTGRGSQASQEAKT
ncbi:glycine betaine/L-proline ABC transporter permease ProW [Afifella marina]|uniref:Glycine betaine/proline transport system permease protein n=2 Tax=Pseudomonadota TaxID=1224 RepID=A0A1G5NC26_AFIMA|nr:glycine betaine/L-proline ABC transporter permease ProW [Afifella marina]MBK1623266.1 proline/glycine betaine ABC transporter permease ProW [Afifella marina DSM 2698]MBK1626260.1 proline/glycine betaine ABC transporter permease ProW [Afifella marina]MBK5917138.1 proline/betaine ABC transporter permease ProW [Afifella marina]RAI22117.1 proline/betaine ABC transporter permease ProW [Afifella marina DSM 2698]SCZ34963.1 glycine betaine/proline transport system permease protein [Afifella marina 